MRIAVILKSEGNKSAISCRFDEEKETVTEGIGQRFQKGKCDSGSNSDVLENGAGARFWRISDMHQSATDVRFMTHICRAITIAGTIILGPKQNST